MWLHRRSFWRHSYCYYATQVLRWTTIICSATSKRYSDSSGAFLYSSQLLSEISPEVTAGHES